MVPWAEPRGAVLPVAEGLPDAALVADPVAAWDAVDSLPVLWSASCALPVKIASAPAPTARITTTGKPTRTACWPALRLRPTGRGRLSRSSSHGRGSSHGCCLGCGGH